jgi:hypothetical protein
MTVGAILSRAFLTGLAGGVRRLEFKLQLASADKLKLELQHGLHDALDGDAV